MKKLILIFVTLMFSLLSIPINIALAAPGHDQNFDKNHEHYHRLIENEKIEELTSLGFTKKEIFMGALIGKQTNKSVEEVLTLYKEKQSWEETAKQLGISLDELKKIDSMHRWSELLKENRKEIVEYLATYSNRSESDIGADLDENISLRFLIGASAIAKISNKDVNDIIALRKEGRSFHEILKTTGVDPIALHRELETFKKEVLKRIEMDETKNQGSTNSNN